MFFIPAMALMPLKKGRHMDAEMLHICQASLRHTSQPFADACDIVHAPISTALA